MYRFARRPLWLVSHFFVLALIVAMFNLGQWQLRRLDERQVRNDTIELREVLPEVRVEDLLAEAGSAGGAEVVSFRRVVAEGDFDESETVLVRSRSMNGAPGFWVLSPLVIDDGRAVVVARGWIAAGGRTDGADLDLPVVDGVVQIKGTAQPSFPGAKPSGTERTTIDHLDLAWYDEYSRWEIAPFSVQAAPDSVPIGLTPLEAPDLTDGPHLSYAVQWFIFTTIAVIGYPWILLRVARDRRSQEQSAEMEGRVDSESIDPDSAVPPLDRVVAP